MWPELMQRYYYSMAGFWVHIHNRISGRATRHIPLLQPLYLWRARFLCQDSDNFWDSARTIFGTVRGRYLFSRCGVGACSCRISQRRTLYRYLYSTQVNKETYSLVLTITHSRIPWDFLHFTPPSSPICTIYYKTMFPPFFLFADQRLIFLFFFLKNNFFSISVEEKGEKRHQNIKK